MEPITILATVGSCVKMGYELGRKTERLIRVWKTTSPALLAINNEIADLTVVLDHLARAQAAVLAVHDDGEKGGGGEKTKAAAQNEDFVLALDTQLRDARKALELFDAFIADVEARPGGFQRKWRWVMKSPLVPEYQRRIRGSRERITDLLAAHNTWVAPGTKGSGAKGERC